MRKTYKCLSRKISMKLTVIIERSPLIKVKRIPSLQRDKGNLCHYGDGDKKREWVGGKTVEYIPRSTKRIDIYA